MAEFKITRFRYTWKGEWRSDSGSYFKDDVVYYNGSAWVCVRQTTSTTFNEEQVYIPPGETLASPAWVKMTDGYIWKGSWNLNETYDEGALVSHGGNVYLCVASHTSSSVSFDIDVLNWEIFATGNNFRNTWEANARYSINDIVRYNGYTYQCIFEHVAGSNSEGIVAGNNDGDDDSTAETWKVLVENYMYAGDYSSNTIYRKNDLVKYGGSILKCTEEHTTSSTTNQIDNTKFETYLPGLSYSNLWDSAEFYAIGDVVQLGGVIYLANENNQASPPGISSTYPNGNTQWSVVQKGLSFKGDFELATLYKEGDIVRKGGSLWVCLRDQVTGDDSTLADLDTSNWELVIGGQNFRGAWRNNQQFNVYDVVYFRGVLYLCNTPHTSSFQNFPGDNGSGFTYWTVIFVGDENSGLTILGDMLTYNLFKEVLHDGAVSFPLGDTSSFGATGIPIGENDQLLTVSNNDGDIGYKTWGNLQRVFFVRTNGVDTNEDNTGYNYFKPWRTIRYALEQADDDYQGFTTILVSTGKYDEILPLIVPARTAVVGEELRGVIVQANDPIEVLASDVPYTLSTLIKIGTLWSDIIEGNIIEPTLGNVVEQDTSSPATSTQSALVGEKWISIISTIEFLANGVGTMPITTGSNTITTNDKILLAVDCIENNREFIKAEAIAYMATSNPSYIFDQEKCLRDLDKFIDAVKYDLLYSGNYKSVLAGRYYGNAVSGSSGEDMWYVRDSTGLRNMTFQGLSGTLPALQEGEFYRIPTGGAYVSLDPGWGPDDDRTWITNRSCYVQNCTTFGTGAIGQKIDGLTHNGGLKSMVSNDFTQIISDGIGAWVSNGGRVELVSVFTYYAHVGMLAKDGGIIRSTNGNNSYGDFGSVADGLDPDEIVRYGTINTQTEQAVVASAFAGEILDYILALEYTNMGQNYTTATYSITSSGTGATSVQEEFKDNAVFECQVLSGGAGLAQYGNQAQAGNELEIVLAAAEVATEEQILGMRIIIISGEGTGQYGYVYSYNSGTKICVVYRESDNQPGWDHINPGTPSKAVLTTGTRYRIEPRPIFSAPSYSASQITLDSSYSGFASGIFSDTGETFTNITGTLGSGTTDGVTPAAAQFTIVKRNKEYSVTLSSGGAGYSVGDEITIDGGDLSGVSTRNDITITVLTTSDDSTNSILTFSYSGNPYTNNGKFILAPKTSTTGLYSLNGTDWNEFTLPSSGNWIGLATNNNIIVSIKSDSNASAYSVDGITWTASSMPSTKNWRGVTYGKPLGVSTGIFVAVAGNLNAGAYSTNGTTWTATTLPTAGDSTICEWTDIAYGAGKFVALANEQNIVAVGTWNGTSLSWSSAVMDVIADSSRKQWVSIAYGNRRFVAISDTGDVAYSFDGVEWLPATMPTADGSTLHSWSQIRYGNGVFFAVGTTGSRTVAADITTGPTKFAATSYDGIVWESRELATEDNWTVVVPGNPDVTFDDSTFRNNKPMWVTAPNSTTSTVNKIYTGARALGRVVLYGEQISYMKLWESGSGYDSLPTVTITCPGKTVDPVFRTRLADGVLSQPTFLSKGSSYKTSSTYVTVSGDGFADKTPNGKYLTVDGLSRMPGPGAQFYIGRNTDYLVAVTVGIDKVENSDGTIRSTFQVSPHPDLDLFIEHGMQVIIREKYSQVRITGHDFLDIGTGNFIDTNYPRLYDEYDYTPVPYQEVYNLNGGRVFYTSTDQSGNFRAGKLFAVEQATGIITISADFFDLAGLTELRLAGVTVGSTAVIREFSKDPLFLQNSNNIIPTERAIKSYLQSRLNIGGEDLLTPSVTAGTVKIGPNEISNTAGYAIDVPVIADFYGSGNGVSGTMLVQAMFARSWLHSSR